MPKNVRVNKYLTESVSNNLLRAEFRLVFAKYLCIYEEIHSKIECIRHVDFYQLQAHYSLNQHSLHYHASLVVI